MELWIRSQDKSCLVNIKAVIMLNKEIRGYYNENPNWFLGKYDNEERALEVLDEIQNILKPKYILNASSIKSNGNCYEKNGGIYQDYSADARIEQLNIYVYEMPEE